MNEEEVRTYHLGESSGLAEAAKVLMDEAMGRWKSGKDDIAEYLRAISHDLSERAAKRHPGVRETATTPERG